MDIIIPYIRSQFQELKYAIRSICKFQPHDKIFVVGYRPEWYTGEFIPYQDIPSRPEYNVVSKILQAIPKMSEDFILWQDDIFKLNNKPITPVYCDTIADALRKRKPGRFRNILENTYNIFPNGYYYGGHTPMVISSIKFIEAVSSLWKDRDYIPKTFYGNFAKIGGEKMPDCKLYGRPDLKAVEIWCAWRDYISTSHYGFSTGVQLYLDKAFPDKCKYER